MKKKVSEWRPVGLHERPGLSSDDTSAISRLLPVMLSDDAAFCERLGWSAAQYRLEEAWRDSPAPSDIRKKLESIRSAAGRLSAQLGVPVLSDADTDILDVLPYSVRHALISAADRHGEEIGGYANNPPRPWQIHGQPEEFVDYHGDSELAAAIEHVQMIAAWCERAIRSKRQAEDGAAVERAKRHGGNSRQARNKGNEPLNDLIARLGNLYRDSTGRKPGISRSVGTKGAPGGPFVRFVLAVCQRMQIPMSATALEKRWRTVAPLVHATPAIERTIKGETPSSTSKK